MTSLRRTSYSHDQRVEQLGEPAGKDAHGNNVYKDANTNEKVSLDHTDLGHRSGYENKSLNGIAERLNFTQREYNDMCRNSSKYTGDGKSMYQPEKDSNNRSGKYENKDPLVSKHNAIVMCRNYRNAQKNGLTNVKYDQEKTNRAIEKAKTQQNSKDQTASRAETPNQSRTPGNKGSKTQGETSRAQSSSRGQTQAQASHAQSSSRTSAGHSSGGSSGGHSSGSSSGGHSSGSSSGGHSSGGSSGGHSSGGGSGGHSSGGGSGGHSSGGGSGGHGR